MLQSFDLVGELADNEIHYMDGSNEQKALYHAVVGGIMSKLTGGDFLAGATAAGINKLVIEEVKKAANYEPDKMQWVSAALGAVVAEFVSSNPQAGGSVAASGTKNNELYEWQEVEKNKIINLLKSQDDSLGIDLQEAMFKKLSNVNELFDLDGDYLSGQFDKENITLEEKKKYMNIVGSYLSNSLEDQYIKTVVVRAKRAFETNRENMNENEVYIFSDSINVPNPYRVSCAVNYTTLVTKNGSMILSPGFSVGVIDNVNTLMPFSSEVYVGPVNIDLSKGDFDKQIVEMLRGNSGTLSGSLFGAGSVSIAQDGTISNYGYGVSTDVIGFNFAINQGRYIGNLRDYK